MSLMRMAGKWAVAPATLALVAAMTGAGVASTGRTWTVQPMQVVYRGMQPFGVSCTRPRFCFTVGQTYSRRNAQTSYKWNGSAWAAKRLPIYTTSQGWSYSGVSCYSSQCLAVASFLVDIPPSLEQQVTGEFWTGSAWEEEPVPTVYDDEVGLAAVSCIAAMTCTAVGSLGTPNGSGGYNESGLVEVWSGATTTWMAEPTPQVGEGVYFSGVSCLSANFCVAVGRYYVNAAVAKSVVESWDGTSWTVQHSPHPAGATNSNLVSVSCSSPTACTAIGDYSPASGPAREMILRWNGTAWSTQHVPAGNNVFNSVSCATDTSCTAVGESADSVGSTSALVIHWNGTRWTTVSTPAVAGQLNAVSCLASGFCMATGAYQSSDDPVSEDN